ncbi:hypothetical protein D3C85_1329510 [compost metagenome]
MAHHIAAGEVTHLGGALLQLVEIGEVEVERHALRTVEGAAGGTGRFAGGLDPALVEHHLGFLVGVVAAGEELAPDVLVAVQQHLHHLPRVARRVHRGRHYRCSRGRVGLYGDLFRKRGRSGLEPVDQVRRAEGQVERHADHRHDDQHPGQPPQQA